jgi:hypothetical protein
MNTNSSSLLSDFFQQIASFEAKMVQFLCSTPQIASGGKLLLAIVLLLKNATAVNQAVKICKTGDRIPIG